MLGSLRTRWPHPWTPGKSALLGLALVLLAAPGTAAASPPTDPQTRARVIGQPVALVVQPPAVALSGPRATVQPVISGRYADGSLRDLTHFCDLTLEQPGVVSLDADRFLTALKDGSTALVVKAGGQTARVPVTVKDFTKPEPVSFRRDLVASLNVGGCNQGACHGTPSGKNGFKLSLRGYDPAADYLQLTRDVLGRRTDRQSPEASLIYRKALGRVPHEGGQRFVAGSVPARTMRAWLAEGLRDDPPTLPALKRVEVLPGSRLLNEPVRWQQLAVLAHFADGSSRDVTRLTVFSSSDSGIASVDANGLVEFGQGGEVAILCRYLDEMVSVRLTYLEPREGFRWSNPPEHNYVDKHVFAKLKMLSIQPSDLCADEEFVRRVYLDVCGVLPTAAEARAFLASKDQDRRARLIDALLERPEYADFWTLKWSDVLRSNRKAIQVKGTHVFQRWVRGHIANNTPLDRVVRDLLTAKGSTFANAPANYYRIARDPTSLGETTAQLFFGIRMQCAKCHNHPFERWTQDDYYGMAAFFARVKQRKDPAQGPGAMKGAQSEYIYLDRAGEVIQPRTGKVMPPRFMGGKLPAIAPNQDRREVLAAWLTSGDNPFFARSVVNRIWYHLLGRGIVDPVDDFRDSNPSANDELLDALARDFVEHKFDVKHLIRTILNSRTYQLSAQSNEFNKDDNKYFSRAVTKLLTAEQLFDALCQVTEVPERFAGMPLGTRAAQLPDGEVNHPFLKTFGQPARELACECEREGDSNLAQALQLINGPAVNDRLRNATNRIGKLLARKGPDGKGLSDRQMLDELYLATLTRLPAPDEVQPLLEHVSASKDRRRAWEDVHWALINSKEFLFRH
jgi:hypothetical protein